MSATGYSTTGTVVEVRHPLVQHKLGLLRDVTTTTQMFRQLVNELTLLLTYEATKDLADEHVEIETPLEHTSARRISGKKVAICPILRAGVGMLDAPLIPGARVGFIGLYRNEETRGSGRGGSRGRCGTASKPARRARLRRADTERLHAAWSLDLLAGARRVGRRPSDQGSVR